MPCFCNTFLGSQFTLNLIGYCFINLPEFHILISSFGNFVSQAFELIEKFLSFSVSILFQARALFGYNFINFCLSLLIRINLDTWHYLGFSIMIIII